MSRSVATEPPLLQAAPSPSSPSRSCRHPRGVEAGGDAEAAHAHELRAARHQRHQRMHEEVRRRRGRGSRETPRKNAKPRTDPIARRYSTAAPISDTRSAATIVRNERVNPRSTDERTVRPVSHLVLESLEVHDVRVDGHADRHDEPGHAGERERQADLVTEERDQCVRSGRRAHEEPCDHDQRRAAGSRRACRARPAAGR